MLIAWFAFTLITSPCWQFLGEAEHMSTVCQLCLTIWSTVGTEVVLCCGRQDCLGATLPWGVLLAALPRRLPILGFTFHWRGGNYTVEGLTHIPTVRNTCGLNQNQGSGSLCDLPRYPHWHHCLQTEDSPRQVDTTTNTTKCVVVKLCSKDTLPLVDSPT